MPGGRFQAPADQECLNCLERPDVPLSPEQSLGRQSGSEGRSERTFSRSAVSEPEGERPHGVSGTGEVSGRAEQGRTERWGLSGPAMLPPPPLSSLAPSWRGFYTCFSPALATSRSVGNILPGFASLPTTLHALRPECGHSWGAVVLSGKGACLGPGIHRLGQGATSGLVVRVSWTCVPWFSKGLAPRSD